MNELHLAIIEYEAKNGVTSLEAFNALKDNFGYKAGHSAYRYWKHVRGIKTDRYGKCKTCNDVFKRVAPNAEYCDLCNPNKAKKQSIRKYTITDKQAYNVWSGMWHRCTNPNSKQYKNYGGRGIDVCDEWQDYYVFEKWYVKHREDGKSIDRIDNNKGYSPTNCRFANSSVQAANQRKRKGCSSQYIGVSPQSNCSTYRAKVVWKGEILFYKSFKTEVEAAKARDKFIIENNLPHTLNFNYG